MNGKLLEARSTGIKVYSGMEVAGLRSRDRTRFAAIIHERLGEEKAKGHMHQPSLDEIVSGTESGDFVLSVHHTENGGDLLVATSHIRRAKSSPANRELGGVLKLVDVGGGQGRAVVEEGTRLARQERGAVTVEALVAIRNTDAQTFFKKLGIETGRRKSDYVKDPKTNKPVDMTIFDVTALAEGRAA